MVNVCESGTLALTQQLNELHVPNIPTTVIEHTTNPSTGIRFNASLPASFSSNVTDSPPPYYATHNVIQQSNTTTTDEEMWDDVL